MTTEKQTGFDDWSKIPYGLCLIRMFHARINGPCLHVFLKVDDRPWHDQPPVPMHSQEISKNSNIEFWEWAEKNMPTFNYPDIVRSAHE